MSTY
ncbi:hypothetical protein F383_38860 [Gossypium arboreum]|jgi:hypothetical protein